ncbi:MAG: hypothetical protein LBP22_00080 [Deltaproteobacteria bacterium]|nr:hypothetical protein [Deltaproteobacteria bacterium]
MALGSEQETRLGLAYRKASRPGVVPDGRLFGLPVHLAGHRHSGRSPLPLNAAA